MNGSGNMSVQMISMLPLQVMLDMVMDLMNRIALKARRPKDPHYI